ncbi:kinesin-like protein KIF12 isoform X2 [Lepisosteus oculatus]|uniref:kinesin-like protein KIF12 isoform X2 n=1 Tax=Lepisosteus oculatus TaxID=7918 RepID=UPI003721EB89
MFHSSSFGQSPETGGLKGTTGEDESNIIVAVRVRPLSDEEHSHGHQAALYCPDRRTLLVSHGGQDRAFTFDVVLEPGSGQHEVFEECGVKRLVDMALEGFSCTVFAFGQTGSGKTYTITGPHSQFIDGVMGLSEFALMQRSLSYLLDQVQSKKETLALSASYLEIYNEQVHDLLNPYLPDSLSVRGSRACGFYVENLSSVEFHSLDAALKLLEEGMRNRQMSSHSLNKHSSRSHCMFTVYIESESAEEEGCAGCLARHGKLCIVDLAGSERAKGTDSTGELLEETSNINRSLLTLGKCISALVDPKKREGHIPYRDSKLTKLLSDSLGGSGVTLMIACVSPSVTNLQETMNTLRYASRARKIKNRPMAKRDLREKLVISLEREVRLLRSENVLLRQELQFLEGERNPGVGRQGAGRSSSEPGMVGVAEGKRGSHGPDHSLPNLLRQIIEENKKLQQEKTTLLCSQEASKQQRALLAQENTRLLRKLEDLERVMAASPVVSSSHSGHSLSSASSCGSANPPHRQHSPAAPPPPAHGHSCHTDRRVACPWYPCLHCCRCPPDSALQCRPQPQWNTRPCPFMAQEDPAPLHPLFLRGGASHIDQHRQIGQLPLLVCSYQHKAAKTSPDCQSALQDQAHQPGPSLSLVRRKKSQAETDGYADRFQVMRDARAQQGGPPPQKSKGKVVPTAPPLPTPPVQDMDTPAPPPGAVRRRVEQTEGLRPLGTPHPRHMTREIGHHGNA